MTGEREAGVATEARRMTSPPSPPTGQEQNVIDLRVTSEQVDDVLLWTGPYADPTIRNICRDWLDMQARLGSAEAVVGVIRSEYPDSAWDVWRVNFAKQPDDVTGCTFIRRLIRAVLAYDAAQPRQNATEGA